MTTTAVPAVLPVPASAPWIAAAACRSVNPELFHPETGGRSKPTEKVLAPAARICAACPVRAECLADAIDTGDWRYGIRAGLWGTERRPKQPHRTCEQCGHTSTTRVCRCCRLDQPPTDRTTTTKRRTTAMPGVADPTELEFVAELPPEDARTRTGRHQAIAAALRQRPGTWALIATYTTRKAASPLASDVRTGRRRPAYSPAGAYQAEVRATGDEARVYARYVGREVGRGRSGGE